MSPGGDQTLTPRAAHDYRKTSPRNGSHELNLALIPYSGTEMIGIATAIFRLLPASSALCIAYCGHLMIQFRFSLRP